MVIFNQKTKQFEVWEVADEIRDSCTPPRPPEPTTLLGSFSTKEEAWAFERDSVVRDTIDNVLAMHTKH
jgi:hypothetical protein